MKRHAHQSDISNSLRFLILTLALFLSLGAHAWAQAPDTSASKNRAKPYAEKWNRWANDGRGMEQLISSIAQDFERLAREDFIAACVALLRANKVKTREILEVKKRLRFRMGKGLGVYSKYVSDSYVNKMNHRPPAPYPSGIPRPGAPWPGLTAPKKSQPSAGKRIARADVALKRLQAAKARKRRDFKTAFRLYSELAEAGDKMSQHSLAWLYLFGDGVKRSYPSAFHWCEKSAKQGYAPAQRLLGEMWKDGLGTQKSESQATAWYRAAAEQGNAKAQADLGMQIWGGLGTTKSSEEAAQWFRKSALQGCAAGQYRLSLCYSSGDGVPKSLPEAIRWLTKASNQGDRHAQYNLGLRHYDGRGVPANQPLAIALFRKSAKQNYGPAKNVLKKLGLRP